MPTVLIVDDEPNIVELSRLYFEREGWRVLSAHDGGDALATAEREAPDLLLLDIMLPALDGWEVCKRLRAAGNTLPIILLTARGDPVDKIVGLEIGADDYVTKPFDPRELVARARALLRRQGWEVERAAPDSGHLVVGPLTIDGAAHVAAIDGEPLSLRPREWDLLVTFARRPGEVLSRDRLLNEVWGYEFYGDSRTVDVHVAALREKLRAANAADLRIETVWGVGYKMVVRS